MTHLPYEDWLLADPSEEPLTPQQTAALQEHLQDCAECRALADALREVEGELRAAVVVEPEAGFSHRFEARLEADRQRLFRRQSLALLGFSVSGAILLLGILALLVWPLFEMPSILFWMMVYRLAGIFTYAQEAQDFFAAFRNTFGAISPIWWVLFAGVLSELAVLWIVSLRLLTKPRKVPNESIH
jgi:anti-sigma factor RsiW